MASRLLLWHCTVPFLPGINSVYPTLFKELAQQRSLFFLLELLCYSYKLLLYCAIYQKAFKLFKKQLKLTELGAAYTQRDLK